MARSFDDIVTISHISTPISISHLKYADDVEITDFMVRLGIKGIQLESMALLQSDDFHMFGEGTQAFKDTDGKLCLVYNSYDLKQHEKLLQSLFNHDASNMKVERYPGPGKRITIGGVSIHRPIVTVVRCLNTREDPPCVTCGQPAHNFMAEEYLQCVPPRETCRFGAWVIDKELREEIFKRNPNASSEEVVRMFRGQSMDFTV